MKKQNAMLLNAVIFSALAVAGCDRNSSGSAPSAPSSASAPATERLIYLGEVELSKITPAHLTVEGTNECTITTMVLPGGTLNLDIAIEPKGGTVTHASVTTRNGQQFTMQVGSITVGLTAKLKAE